MLIVKKNKIAALISIILSTSMLAACDGDDGKDGINGVDGFKWYEWFKRDKILTNASKN